MANKEIIFPYPDVQPLVIPGENLINILSPRRMSSNRTEIECIEEGLNNPSGVLCLEELLTRDQEILILVDDYTRNTPTDKIMSLLIKRFEKLSIPDKNVKLLVASGTHRAMTLEEKRKKYGSEVVERFEIIDHLWQEEGTLVDLGTTPRGTEIWINRGLLSADFTIGIGHIVPHRVAGFGGGSKIVQPGVCGPVTTGQTHWISACYDGEEIIGRTDNPVRTEINLVGEKAGLDFIINTIHDGSGRVYQCVCGDPIQAFAAGCRTARSVYGVPLSEPGDIVVADSYPSDMDLWQAAKSIYAADLAMKEDGILVLVSPCPEGVSSEHPEIVDIGYQPFKSVKSLLDNGEIDDLTMAAHLAHVGRVVKDKGKCILVSTGINKATAEKLGFYYAASPQEAYNMAVDMKGKNSRTVVLKNGGEIMPLLK